MGVLSSSALFVLAVHAAGAWFREAVGARAAIGAALLLVGVLLMVDGLRVWAGRTTSLGPARQTPYQWRLKGRVGMLGWGLDTGLPVSTVRATSLPALGVVLVATGHAGPFHGLFYGLGVCVGVLAGLPALRSQPRADRAMNALSRRRTALGPARLVLLPSGLTAAGLALSLAFVP